MATDENTRALAANKLAIESASIDAKIVEQEGIRDLAEARMRMAMPSVVDTVMEPFATKPGHVNYGYVSATPSEEWREQRVRALGAEATIAELKAQKMRLTEQASAPLVAQKPNPRATGLGRPPAPFWADVIGWAAAWIVEKGVPPTAAQARIAKVMEDRAAALGHTPGLTALKEYAQGLLNGVWEFDRLRGNPDQ